MPSTTSATIIMVANTGRLMEMSERNIGSFGLEEQTRGAAARDVALLAGRADAGLLAGDRHLHATAECAHVADDDAITGLEAVRHLHEAEPIVDGAQLHGGHVDGAAVDAVDVWLAVVRRLTKRAIGHGEHVGERAAHHAASGERTAAERAARVRDLDVHGDGTRGRIDRGTQ